MPAGRVAAAAEPKESNGKPPPERTIRGACGPPEVRGCLGYSTPWVGGAPPTAAMRAASAQNQSFAAPDRVRRCYVVICLLDSSTERIIEKLGAGGSCSPMDTTQAVGVGSLRMCAPLAPLATVVDSGLDAPRTEGAKRAGSSRSRAPPN
jgi:hypothetical protein